MTINEQEFAPDSIYLPMLFKRGSEEGDTIFDSLINLHTDKIIVDQFPVQKKELFKIRQPTKKLDAEEIDSIYNAWSKNRVLYEEGCWVFYPWLHVLIHILEKEEFIELRTNRNHYKITPAEQKKLSSKKIGIIGLSVGHAVAITMATERTCGTLKLADFDTIELSNLNRIKTGIQNIGLNKCVVTAREIAEIDPFINVDCYMDGLDKNNLSDFLLNEGKLDLLIDECDGIDMKIMARFEARKLGIPVLMETSDRGMLDIERFDLDPERDIFHGKLNDVPPQILMDIPDDLKLALTLKIIDVEKTSSRGKASLIEVGQSINTWPQLASAVTMGGGVVTDVSRRILLQQYDGSGRVYIDLEQLAGNKKETTDSIATPAAHVFDIDQARNESAKIPGNKKGVANIEEKVLYELVGAANNAPSPGNNQPWKWLYKNNTLDLFYDTGRNLPIRDPLHNLDYMSLGGACQNMMSILENKGLSYTHTIFPLGIESNLVASFYLNGEISSISADQDHLALYINLQHINRNPASSSTPSPGNLQDLQQEVDNTDGTCLDFLSDPEQLDQVSQIIAETERLMLLNKKSNREYFEKVYREATAGNNLPKDGYLSANLGMSMQQAAILNLLKNEMVAEHLKNIDGGNILRQFAYQHATAIVGIVTSKGTQPDDYFYSGMAIQRMWLKAHQLKLSVLPQMSVISAFEYLKLKDSDIFDKNEMNTIRELQNKFLNIITGKKCGNEIFIFRLFKSEKKGENDNRIPVNETLFAN